MKRYFKYLIALVAAGLLLAGCSKDGGGHGPEPASEREELSVSFSFPETKGTALTAEERNIAKMYLFAFGSDGELDIFHSFTAAELTAMSATVRVRCGEVKLWLVANVPFTSAFLNDLQSEDQLKEFTYGFPRVGGIAAVVPFVVSATVNVPRGGMLPADEPNMVLVPAVSRIVFGTVTNELEGSLSGKKVQVAGAVLCNVVGNATVGGTEPATPLWYNQECRRGHVKEDVIGYKWASFGSPTESQFATSLGITLTPGQTLWDWYRHPSSPYTKPFTEPMMQGIIYMPAYFMGDNDAVNTVGVYAPGYAAVGIAHDSSGAMDCVMYAFPNTRSVKNNGWHDDFLPTSTTAVIIVDIGDMPSAAGGTRYWYPVPLDGFSVSNPGIEAGKEYTVNLVLKGPGNTEDEPFRLIARATLEASIDVKDWVAGASYSETI